MRTQPILAFLAAAILSTSAFAAPSIPPAQRAVVNVAGTQDALHGTFRLFPEQVQDMRGAFRLTDGRTLTVQDQQAKLFMKLDGKREELVPVGPNQFVARESGLRVSFDQLPFAEKVVVQQPGR